MSDIDVTIENLTYGLNANAIDLSDIWLKTPGQFREREINEIRQALLHLQLLLSAINTKEAA